jgi:8-oxo-dGTP pyrophosphatase MutT (NUDIX family)
LIGPGFGPGRFFVGSGVRLVERGLGPGCPAPGLKIDYRRNRLGGVTLKNRRAARVLLIDDAGRTLLFHGGDPARPGERYWFTPGGGLEDGETRAQGAVRELFEETGLRVDPAELGEPIFAEVAEFSYDNNAYRQEQEFFLYRVSEWRVDTAGFDAQEQLTIDEHRWWSAAEIDSSEEQIYPSGLADLLRKWNRGL